MQLTGFSPRNGESVLKCIIDGRGKRSLSFSPRNGESVLKDILWEYIESTNDVSVPAMGKVF